MNKKSLKVLGFVLFFTVLAFIFIMPVRVISSEITGSCCPQLGSICVYGGVVALNYYYQKDGPCD